MKGRRNHNCSDLAASRLGVWLGGNSRQSAEPVSDAYKPSARAFPAPGL